MKQFLTALGIIGAITGVIVFFVLKDAAADSERRTEEAPVIGLVATPVVWDDGDNEQSGHTLTFSFVDAAARVHPQTIKEVSWYRPDKGYKVCYTPQDANDWGLYPSDHPCGS